MKATRSRFLLGTCLAGAALSLLSSPALAAGVAQADTATSATAPNAQQGTAPGGTPTSSGGTTGLQEIIVTAQHRATDVQKTPASISVLGGGPLKDTGNSNLNDALRSLPAVQVHDDPNGSVVVIRGVQPVFNTDPTINISVDGVYQLFPSAMPVFDLQRIEVLKGPQGTQYGRNALGGVVNFVNNTPGDTFGGHFDFQYGNYNSLRLEGAVNVPISDWLSTRTAVLRSQHDGYLSDGNSDERTTAVREIIRLKPTQDFKIWAEGEYDHYGGHGFGNVPAPLSTHPDNPWYDDSEPAGRQDNENKLLTVVAEYDLHWARLFGQAAFQKYRVHVDQELEGPAIGFGAGGIVDKTRTYEARFSSPFGSAVQWQIGYYHLYTSNDTLALPGAILDVPHFLAATAAGNTQYTSSNAGYGTITYPIASKLRVTGGVRYTVDDKHTVTGSYDTASGALLQTFYGSKNFKAFTYEGVVEYDIAPRSTVYAKVSKGFKAGGLNPAGVAPESYKPEVINAFEVGSKNEFFDRTLRVNVDAYYYNDHNKQVQTVSACDPLAVPSSCPFPVTATTNASKAKIYGAELQSLWNFTPRDQLSFDVAYTHARFKHFEFTVFNPPFIQTIDRSGTQLPNAPTWSGTVGYQHTFEFADTGDLAVQVNGRFSSGYDSDVNFDYPDQHQNAFAMGNAVVTWTPAHKIGDVGWKLSAFINNFTNIAVRQRADFGNRIFLERPRTFGGTLGITF